MRIAVSFEPRVLNPAAEGEELAYPVASNIYNRLVTVTSDGRVIPDLAESWSLDATLTTYTFRLRRDVKWHDGIPFTAHDVKWTLEAFRATRAPVGQLVQRIAGITVVDDHTISLRLTEPWAPFVVTLGEFDAVMLPRHRYAAGDWTAAAENAAPVGTGPFTFGEWRRGHSVRLDANTEYFREGPFVASLEFLFVPDARRAAAMIGRGDADLLIGRPVPEDLRQLARSPDVSVTRTPSDARYYAIFNHRRRPFSERSARLGANLAIDRRVLVTRALGGIGAPAFGFFTPQIPWAYNDRAELPPRDAARAATLLHAPGVVPAGRPIVIATSEVSTFVLLAEELARQFSALGVPAIATPIPLAGFVKALNDAATEWDMALLGGGNWPDPDILRLRFASDGLLRFSGYASPRFDAAVREGGRRADMPARAAAYRRAQELLAEELPIMPLAEGVRVTVSRRRVRGLPQTDARGLVGDFDYSLARLER